MKKKGRKKYYRKRPNDIPVNEMLPTLAAFYQIAKLVGATLVHVSNYKEPGKPEIDNVEDADAEIVSSKIKKPL